MNITKLDTTSTSDIAVLRNAVKFRFFPIIDRSVYGLYTFLFHNSIMYIDTYDNVFAVFVLCIALSGIHDL